MLLRTKVRSECSPACFPQDFLGLVVLKSDNKEHEGVFEYGTITLSGCPFQGHSSNQPSSKCSPSETFLLRWNAPDVIIFQPPPHLAMLGVEITNSKFQIPNYKNNFTYSL